MIEFSNKELGIIAEKCGSEYVQRYSGIVKKSGENIVKVVNTGMVSSGKSSLFNVLVDSIEEEHFPTGAARTTTMADCFDYNNISFIDTPGIDVKSEDDAVAFSTIMEADLIMIVHNIRTGPINRSEAEWIEEIVKRMNDTEMCKARMMFVCTWKDTREKDEDYEDILNDVKKQLFEIIGTEIPFFDVSVNKYMTGVSNNKEVLKKNSGVLELKHHLDEYAASYMEKKSEMNAEEMNLLMSEIRSILIGKKSSCNEQIEKIKFNVGKQYKTKQGTWRQVFNFFSSKRDSLNELQKEYKELGGETKI